MPSSRETIRGVPLAEKPMGVSRCGMSRAKYAQHCMTSKWCQLSAQGQIIGSAIDLDFYRQDIGQGPRSRPTDKTKELTGV